MTFADEIGAEAKKFTAEEVLELAATGLLDERLELLEGVLIVMSPQGAVHAGLTARIHRLMERNYGDAYHVRDHSDVRGTIDSLPEPDIAVVRGEPRLDAIPGPADIVLILEIADSSLRRDRRKAEIYSAAGYAEYWLVNVNARVLEVYSQRNGAGEYGRRETHAEHAHVPLPVSGARIRVSDLLP